MGSARGMTLIELMIALIIVGGLLALVVPSIQAVAGVNVKEAAGKLSGTIGYLYSHTAITGETCRIAFTFPEEEGESGKYAVECTEGSPRLSTEKIDVRDGAMDEGPRSPWEQNEPVRDDQKLEAQIKQAAQWTQFAGKNFKPQTLPAGVRLAGVWTGRLREAVTKGQAYLYFFPLGETQKARIWLADASDNFYTLTVAPLTGKVKVFNENLEIPRD